MDNDNSSRPIISQHIFLFPFRISHRNKEADQPVIKDAFNAFQNSGWRYKPYNPTDNSSNYSEFYYFHEYIRKAFFGTRSETDALNSLSQAGPENTTYYFERDPGVDSRMVIHIKNAPDAENIFGPYSLCIDHLSLRLFETGIGIITVELMNYDYDDLDDVLVINDFGRRLYPQYMAPVDQGADLAAKGSFLPDRIEFRCKDFESDEILKADKFLGEEPRLADYMEQLIGEEFLLKFKCIAVIDDRMYTVCWHGNNSLSRNLKEVPEDSDHPRWKEDEWWYKFIFIDGKSLGCAPGEMMNQLISDHTYDRWAGWGTLFGASRYSLVCLADSEWFSTNILRNHMQTMYYQLAVLLLAQRASFLKFTADIARISGKIEAFIRAQPQEASSTRINNRNQFDEIAWEVKKLQADYIQFVSRLWFKEVTPQDQGIELYDMALKAMGTEPQIERMKGEINELYNFVELNYARYKAEEDKKTAIELNRLNKIASTLAPVAFMISIWGIVFGMSPLKEYDLWSKLLAGLSMAVLGYLVCLLWLKDK